MRRGGGRVAGGAARAVGDHVRILYEVARDEELVARCEV